MSNFSPKTLDFLFENMLQNDKEWFHSHDAQYRQYVLNPLKALVENIAPALYEIDPRIVAAPKIGGSISRIWRDTRFSKDKSLFRSSMWCSFSRQKNAGLPEFYFVVTHESFFYGSGFYCPGAATMESMRRLILNEDKAFKDALHAYENQDLFVMEGDMYKRDRYPEVSDSLKSWLNRKTIYFTSKNNDLNLLYSDKLCETMAQEYKILAPIYNFFLKAEEYSRHE